jgi:predicted SAM-dependent methyltransferase
VAEPRAWLSPAADLLVAASRSGSCIVNMERRETPQLRSGDPTPPLPAFRLPGLRCAPEAPLQPPRLSALFSEDVRSSSLDRREPHPAISRRPAAERHSMSPITTAFAERRRRSEGPDLAPPPSGPQLNLGCGPVQPSGWVNIDGSRRAWLATRLAWLDRLLVRANLLSPTEFGPMVRIHDLKKPLPYANDSVSCIYSGELWEHFEFADAARLTHECHRVLAPGGVLRICVPDGAAFWRRYLEIYDEEMTKPLEARAANLLRDHVQLYFNDIATRRIWLGSLGHTHKWQFDEVQLLQLVRDAGFVEVRRMRFHESHIPDIERVERSDFLIVEGIKPAATASLLPAEAVRAREAALRGDAVEATPQSQRA